MTAAVAEMKWWVTLEERLVKRLCRLTTVLALWRGDFHLGIATGSMCTVASQPDLQHEVGTRDIASGHPLRLRAHYRLQER
ncbi:MAG: hypothetical protein JSS39_15980 [Nitrospira sp.]|nr:hypothetical protein [Nitrospira sp.]